MIDIDELKNNSIFIGSLEDVFGFRKAINWIFPILVSLFGIYTVIQEGIPISNPTIFYLTIIFLEVTFFGCGYGASIIIFSILYLYNISQCKIVLKTISFPKSEIKGLYQTFQFANFYLTIYYIILIVAIYFGPYGLSKLMLLWLYSLAPLPFSSLVLFILWIHNIMLKVKNQIIILFQEFNRNKNNYFELEERKKYLEIYQLLNNYQEWPFSPSSFTSLVISIIPLLLQAYLAWFSHQELIR